MKTFKEWITETYDANELRDIANQGCASCAPGGLIYYHETMKAYETHSEEIWDWMNEMKESMGYNTVLELLASFNSAKDIISDAGFKNMMVWAYVEEIARNVSDQEEAE